MIPHSGKIYNDSRDAFFEELYFLARQDRDIILMIGDQGALSIEKIKNDLPEQFVNAGIAEQNMIGVAAGLALSNKKVFVHTIIPFLTLRAYEQIKIGLSIMRLPVVLVGVGAGLNYGSDGPTHHATQDLAIMRVIPHLTIFSASDSVGLSSFVHLALEADGPVYVRFEKGNFPALYKLKEHDFHEGLGELRKGKDLAIIATGSMAHKALEVAELLKDKNLDAKVVDLYRLKPVNEKKLSEILDSVPRVITLEEHLAHGGLGSIVSDLICDYGLSPRFKRIGLLDEHNFDYGSREYMLKKVGLDAENLAQKIASFVKAENNG